jgi:hypothetical protein
MIGKRPTHNVMAGSAMAPGAPQLSLKRRIIVVALALSISPLASRNDAHAAGNKIGPVQAAETHKCSVSGFKSAKEYNSSTWPWFIYSTCMTKYGLKP